MPIHDGHRDRVRERFLQDGLDGFSDVQALEFLLFHVIPRKDTNPIAHALLDHFGSFSQVLEASAEELTKVPGVGESTAAFLKLIPEAGRFYETDRANRNRTLLTLDACAQYLIPRFYGRSEEVVFLLCLDARCNVLCCRMLSDGDVNSASVSVRRVAEIALASRASSAVLAHNHPAGSPQPSREDIMTTQAVASALHAIGVELVDHIIVAGQRHTSMAQEGYPLLP